MDAALDGAWREGEKPFHYLTLIVQIPDIEAFLWSLNMIAKQIETYLNTSHLNIAHDWHEHDGFLVEGKAISFPEFKEAIFSESKIREISSDDYNVYIAIFPEDREFLLRFRIHENETVENKPFKITFSGYGQDIAEVYKNLIDRKEILRSVQNSKEYFQKIYAG